MKFDAKGHFMANKNLAILDREKFNFKNSFKTSKAKLYISALSSKSSTFLWVVPSRAHQLYL